MSKKILIISIAAGSGHIRAAQALAEYAQASLPDISAEHINISDIANPLIKLFNQDIFELSIENWPKVWGKAYEASDNRPMASVLGRSCVTTGSVKCMSWTMQKNCLATSISRMAFA